MLQQMQIWAFWECEPLILSSIGSVVAGQERGGGGGRAHLLQSPYVDGMKAGSTRDGVKGTQMHDVSFDGIAARQLP